MHSQQYPWQTLTHMHHTSGNVGFARGYTSFQHVLESLTLWCVIARRSVIIPMRRTPQEEHFRRGAQVPFRSGRGAPNRLASEEIMNETSSYHAAPSTLGHAGDAIYRHAHGNRHIQLALITFSPSACTEAFIIAQVVQRQA